MNYVYKIVNINDNPKCIAKVIKMYIWDFNVIETSRVNLECRLSKRYALPKRQDDFKQFQCRTKKLRASKVIDDRKKETSCTNFEINLNLSACFCTPPSDLYK